MDVNNFQYTIAFAEEYADYYEGNVIWGTVSGLSTDFDQVFPQYINVPSYYAYSYTGKVSGTWHDVSDYSDYAVVVYVKQDADYKVITCPLKADGTWESTITYRETYTVPEYDEETGEEIGTTTEVVTYDLDVEVAEGIKEFRLAKRLTSTWETISSTDDMVAERLICSCAEELSEEDGGRPYSYFSYFTARL